MFAVKNINLKLLKAILLLMLLIFSMFTFSQVKKGKNLVPNSGFETYKSKNRDIKAAIPWIGVGTVDYHMKPEKRDTSRFKGAHKGKCYAGLRFQADYKEYMYVKLKEPLEKGSVYNFKMYVRMLEAKSVTVSIKQLGVYFSEGPFYVGMEFKDEGLIDSTNKKGLTGLNWMLIQGDYRAHGGENYIIIGNFISKMKDDMVRKKKIEIFKFHEAYYYIDDVTLRKKNIPVDSAEIARLERMYKLPTLPEKVEDGQVIKIENIYFEGDSDVLTSASYRILDEYVDLLDQNPFMVVEIVGHADSKGVELLNNKLSTDRAKVIYEYFKNSEVLNPMTYKGEGSSFPIDKSGNEEAKKKNNRIEIVIIKQ